jgi:ribonuclease G
MGNMLVINSMLPEVRVALLEDGRLAELYVERENERGVVGNLYRGRVVRVLPGMQAAFVDIGLERAAFLYVSDARPPSAASDPDEEVREQPGDARIEELLIEGQPITVQVAKEPLGTKGARVTTHVTLPGRYLVYLPNSRHIGVSRRIESPEERERLRNLMEELQNEDEGFIVRTVAEGATREQLKQDMEFLRRLWKEIQRRQETASMPELLFYDLNVTLRSIRDLCNEQTERVTIDNPEDYYRIKRFLSSYMPEANFSVELSQDDVDIFDVFGITHELKRALGRKVWLKNGGYLVIDQAEALTAIDVNTGRFVGRKNLQDTILQTNMEAVQEIVYQLRLRNIGGLIIIDFIDMERSEHRDQICNALVNRLKPDRARSNVLKISELGLVEMTRKRVRESLGRTLTEPCFYCEGRGTLKSKTTICYEIFREVMRTMQGARNETVGLSVHPKIAEHLKTEEYSVIRQLEESLLINIQVREKDNFHLERFSIHIH